MKARKHKFSKGVSLIEIMVAVTILSVAVIGASGYRYYAVLDANEADEHIAAARIALLFCESWRGTGGSTTFDPITYFGTALPVTDDSGFGGFGTIGSETLTFNTLGNYQVVLDGIDYHVLLSWADINPSLRALNIVVGRLNRSSRNQAGFYETNPEEQYQLSESTGPDAYKLFKLTTYTEI
jgi:prepilin-type N-terminal cleavage/methylation domain-containing protein